MSSTEYKGDTKSSDPMFVFAFTALKAPYPEFINVTRLDDGSAKIIVRGVSGFYTNDAMKLPKPGATVEIVLPAAAYENMIKAAINKL